MSRTRCEREAETAAAVRAGLWSVELSGHVERCAICAETRQVSRSLMNHAAELRTEYEPAAASLIWRRAQVREQESALKRVTRPLIFMRLLSLGCGVIFAVWLLSGFGVLEYRGLVRSWVGVGTAWAGALVAVMCIAAGAWYLLHEGRRSGGFDGSGLISR